MRLVTIIFTLFLLSGCEKKVVERAVRDQEQNFQAVISAAKTARAGGKSSGEVVVGDELVPSDLNSEEMLLLFKELKQHDWDLDTYGTGGITLIEKVTMDLLYSLASQDDGVSSLVELMEDIDLSWDGAHSLTLQDALVKCGRGALPALRQVKSRKHLAERCIELIEQGVNTAF